MNKVIKFDPSNNNFSSFPTNASYPWGVADDNDGNVYTINLNSNNVTKINANDGVIKKIFQVGRRPYTYSNVTGFIYRKVTLKQ